MFEYNGRSARLTLAGIIVGKEVSAQNWYSMIQLADEVQVLTDLGNRRRKYILPANADADDTPSGGGSKV